MLLDKSNRRVFSKVLGTFATGDLVAFEPAPWPGTLRYWFARWVLRDQVVHIGTVITRKDDTMLIEADVPAVRIDRLAERLPCWWLPLNLPTPWTREQIQQMLTFNGLPYGYLDVIRLYFGLPMRDMAMNCIEHTCAGLERSGFDTTHLATMWPEDLLLEVARRVDTQPIWLVAK